MFDINTIKDDLQMKALTGLSLEEFCYLVVPFKTGYQQILNARHPPHYSPHLRSRDKFG